MAVLQCQAAKDTVNNKKSHSYEWLFLMAYYKRNKKAIPNKTDAATAILLAIVCFFVANLKPHPASAINAIIQAIICSFTKFAG
jgi:hypothetical protein